MRSIITICAANLKRPLFPIARAGFEFQPTGRCSGGLPIIIEFLQWRAYHNEVGGYSGK